MYISGHRIKLIFLYELTNKYLLKIAKINYINMILYK